MLATSYHIVSCILVVFLDLWPRKINKFVTHLQKNYSKAYKSLSKAFKIYLFQLQNMIFKIFSEMLVVIIILQKNVKVITEFKVFLKTCIT